MINKVYYLNNAPCLQLGRDCIHKAMNYTINSILQKLFRDLSFIF